MSVAKKIEQYRGNGHISIDRHVNSRVVELGRSLDSKIAIYLDIKFWIVLRNVALGRDRGGDALELLRLLRQAVRTGNCFVR